MSTAIFVDAGFFIKRFRHVYPTFNGSDPSLVARTLHKMCLDHLTQRGDAERRDLYRIFAYDCPPLTKKAHSPLGKVAIDFGKTDVAAFRLEFHNELKRLRKVALRLGRLQDRNGWRIKPTALSAVLRKERQFGDLTDRDFEYEVRQKGTDMKIGIDIASVAYKKQVDQIVLVAGDADFVPAAKLARREGIDFILDPMWNPIPSDLHEHIDGLRSTSPEPTAHATNDVKFRD
ncbi:MAG: NYN domain-containing protein [Alphaproteobacteria bacterium]|nr:NYN domain-containing protein [Alphaproteobacteria bacterium]MDE2113138.1 NYN domain-containing protein [Alphaproteobacteria bacterium]